MNKKIRKQFPILKTKMNGKPLIYFDNGATTQKPWHVIDTVSDYYEKYNANVHRSLNPLAEKATLAYEDSRKLIAKFINGSPSETIFTSGTTESLNLVAQSWGRNNLKKGDRVVLTITEHHSNIVPWLQLKKEIGIEVVFISLKDGALDIAEAKKLITHKNTKVVAFQLVSNTLGVIHDYEKLLELAREQNAITVIDAAQAMAHMEINVHELGCDFLAFSGHKMFGPTGIGILWGRKKLLREMSAWQGGGEMIHEVFVDKFTENDTPYKFEAGTPNIAGAIGLGAAVEFINALGDEDKFEAFNNHEKNLTEYLLYKLGELDFITIFGHTNSAQKIPTIAFEMKDVHGHDVGDLLGNAGIAVRAGHHCTQPLHDSLKVTSTVRVSLSIYNTEKEIDILVEELKKIHEKFNS